MNESSEKRYLIDLEKSIIGAIFIDPNCASDVISTLKDSRPFYLTKHKIIFNSILELYNNSTPVDMILAIDNIQKIGQGDGLTASYFSELIEAGNQIDTGNIKYHCNRLLERFLKRNLENCCIKTLQTIRNNGKTSMEIIESLSSELSGITSEVNTKIKDMTYWNALDELVFCKEHRGIYPGIETGYDSLDKTIKGFDNAGDYVLLAGRTSMGKTCFMLNLAIKMANRDVPVGILGLESSVKKLYLRLICRELKYDLYDFYSPNCTDEAINSGLSKLGEIGTLPLFMWEVPGISITELKAKAFSMRKKHEIQLLFVDHLGEIISEGKTIFERTSTITQQLKSLSMEMHIPVIALCQLNRKPPDRERKEPILSDLRNSGDLEQQADKVIFLHRPNYYRPYREKFFSDESGHPENLEVIVAKNRDGKTGKIDLKYYEKWGLIENYGTKEEREYMVKNCE